MKLLITPADILDQAAEYLRIIGDFERIADHAVNIAQWVIFSVTGVHEEGAT